MLKNLPVHPSANLFPMVSDDELQEMADDIKQNGLIHPVVTGNNDGELYLIDGRNRLAACELVGVEPDVIHHDGDVNTYINSANNLRRELTKGQKAMSYAVMFPDAYDKSLPKVNNSSESKMLSYARKVINVLPGLQDNVLSGAVGLNDAYQQAQEIERAAKRKEASIDMLNKSSPDLYDRVRKEELTLDEAKTLDDKNHEEERARIATDVFYFEELMDALKIFGSIESLTELLDNVQKGVVELRQRDRKLISMIFRDGGMKMELLNGVYEK